MSLWVQLTLKDLSDPKSEGHAGLVNLERALWMEPYEGDESGSVLHFASDETVMVGESLEEIVELLDAAEGLGDEDDLEFEEEEE